jgi:uncharacterized protein with HEPN domain
MSSRDRFYLESILTSIRKIEAFVQGVNSQQQFYEDQKTFDSVLMNFVIIGELVGKLTEDTRNGAPQIEWNKIKAFRNLVAHNYFGLDSEEIWQLIHSHLPLLKERLTTYLNNQHAPE